MFYKVIIPFKREEQNDPSIVKDYYAEGKAYYIFEKETNKLVANFMQLEGKVKVKVNRKNSRLYNVLYSKTRLKMFGPYEKEKRIIDVTKQRNEINRYFWFSKKQVHACLTYLSGSFMPESLKIIDRTSVNYNPSYNSEFKGRRFVKIFHEYWPRVEKGYAKTSFDWKEINSMETISFETLMNEIATNLEAVVPHFVKQPPTLNDWYWWFMRDNHLDEDMFVFKDRTMPKWVIEDKYWSVKAPKIIERFEHLVRTNQVDKSRQFLRKKHKEAIEYSREYKSKPSDFIFEKTSRSKSQIAHIVENKMIKYKLWDQTLTVADVIDQIDPNNYLLLDHKTHMLYDDHKIIIEGNGKLKHKGNIEKYQGLEISKRFMNDRREKLLQKRNDHINEYEKIG